MRLSTLCAPYMQPVRDQNDYDYVLILAAVIVIIVVVPAFDGSLGLFLMSFSLKPLFTSTCVDLSISWCTCYQVLQCVSALRM